MQSVNPATEELIETFDPYGDAAVDAAISRADARFKDWRKVSFSDRATLMRRAAELLEARIDTLAATPTAEMGKPIVAAEAEVRKCALNCRHYADHAERYLADEAIATDAKTSFVAHQPIGPVLAVMPWNFPYWQVIRFAAPALMAGNVALLKHASNVSRCALHLEALFRDAGFPDGCFQTLLIGSDKVERVIKDPRVRATTLTGSGPAGGAVAAAAGKEIKKTVLELGGNDAFIVMPSADLDAAIETAVDARITNNGQSCIAAKRFFAHSQVYDRFKSGFVDRFNALNVGDPTRRETDIGPLSTLDGRSTLIDQVEASIAHGGRRITRLAPLPERGYYVSPAILEAPPHDSPAGCDELFGPVAALWPVDSLDEAIARANASVYGLGSAIFTQSEEEMRRAVRDLDAGSTFVNAKVASDPRVPFGGVKQSGYGRELSADGIREFVNRKTVWIA